MARLTPPGFIGTTSLLARRELGGKLTSPWFFVVATAVCLMAYLYGSGFQQAFQTESVLVTSDPLLALNVMVVVFLGVVLGLRLAAGLSGEREHQTLEVLLVASVPWTAILLAKFAVELCLLWLLMAVYAAYLLLGQPLGAGVIALRDLWPVAQMPLLILPVMGFGVLVSARAGTVRGAVLAYLVLVGALAAYEGALGLLRLLPAAEMSLSALYLRAGLEGVAPLLRPVSPAAPLADLVEMGLRQIPLAPGQILHALALTLGLLVLAVPLARATLRGARA